MRGIRARAGKHHLSAFLIAALPLAAVLAGCADLDNALFGSESTTEETTPDNGGAAASMPGTLPGTQAAQAGTLPPSATATAMGTGATVTPIPIEPGIDTGTAVNRKVQDLRNDLNGLQGKIAANAGQLDALRGSSASSASAYHESRAHITARLQMGTTRGNPELVAEWNNAQTSLDLLTANVNQMTALGTDIANDSSRAHYDLDSIQAAFNISGAVDEDHRQLSVLQDETNQTIVLIDKLLTEVSSDIQRQTAYIANERANLATLASAIKNGELYGGLLGGVSFNSGGSSMAGGSFGGAGTALVTIKFDRPDVDYQQILYTALAQALQSRPNAGFDVVAISPTRGTVAGVQLAQTAAKRHAQDVFRSMTDMGVPATRLALSSATDPSITTSEVRVFVR